MPILPSDETFETIYPKISYSPQNDSYNFESEQKRSSFLFKTHINYLRNYFRDNKSFEAKNQEVDLHEEHVAGKEELPQTQTIQLRILQNQLDRLEEWERILLLMRGQDMPYSDIAQFINKPEKHLKVYYARLKKQLLISMNESLQKLNELK